MEIPLKQFAELQDPRLARTRRHLLADIVLLAIAAILSGAEGWDDMERYGKAKRDCLKSFLALPFGIPSHDTFNRVFQVLEPAELKKQFLDWVSVIARRTQGEVVAIDGKSLRGTGTGPHGLGLGQRQQPGARPAHRRARSASRDSLRQRPGADQSPLSCLGFGSED